MKISRVIAILLVSAFPFAAAASELLIFDTGGTSLVETSTPKPAGTTYPVGPAGGGGLDGGAIGFSTIGPYSPVTLHITVSDLFAVGDVFEAILDGLSVGITSAVPMFSSTHSTGDFYVTVAGGAHSLDVWDIVLSYLGFASPFGGGMVPFNFTPAQFEIRVAQVVPEPSSMLLLGAGLVALGLFGRRKLS
jgi:hypothetical protein